MENIIVLLIIIAIITAAILKIVHEKKQGAKCIGCPYSKNPSKNCSCNIEK